jgi:hypothetical protein
MTGKEVPAGSLDLLVIDEAGQFSLANTLAVSRAAFARPNSESDASPSLSSIRAKNGTEVWDLEKF